MKLINKVSLFSILIFLFTCSDKDDDILPYPDEETVHEFELHSNNRVSSLLMTQSEYNSWLNNDDFSNGNKRHELFKDIYKKFPDKYDFIFLVLNEESKPPSPSYFGRLIGVSNDIEGIGLNLYDNSSEYGSSGKLKAVMQLSALEFIKYGPALHEIAHNWANFSLSTHSVNGTGSNLSSYPYGSHWGFTGGTNFEDGGKGQLGGFSQSSLIEHGDNLYSVEPFGPNANGGNGIPYNELELYLMGMIPISSVSNFDMFTDITSFNVSESSYDFIANSRTTFDPKSLEDLLGKRIPNNNNSKKNFKLLVVVLTDNPLTEEEWNKVDATAEWFSRNEDDGTSLYNFWEATNGLGSVTIEN